MYFENWKYIIYVSEALARACKLHVHDFYFYVGTFGGTKELATLLLDSNLHSKSPTLYFTFNYYIQT